MRTFAREIDGPADFELGRPRTAPVSYVAVCPPGRAKGLAFLIPGFGNDTSEAYADSLRRHVAKTHGMVAVSVRYHCYGARPTTGAKIDIDLREIATLVGLASRNGVALDDQKDVLHIAQRLAAAGVKAQARGTLRPARGEYQNFGVLQAMDHLAVLGDIMQAGISFDTSRIVALGSSHGGYIAHMMAKIAPRTLAMVIDNSSYTQPPIDFLGAPTSVEFISPLAGPVLGFLRTESGWNHTDRMAANFYDRDRDLIRDLTYPIHVEANRAAAGEAPTKFRMVNASKDTTSPAARKQQQVAVLRALGFDAQLLVVEEEHLDGKLFKTLEHGMDASLASLFDLAVPDLQPRDGALDSTLGATVTYEGMEKVYQFTHSAKAPYVTGQVVPRFAGL